MLQSKRKVFRLSLVSKIAALLFLAFALVLGNEIRLGIERYIKNTLESDASATVRTLDKFSKDYINVTATGDYSLSSDQFQNIYKTALDGNYDLIKCLVDNQGKIINLTREVEDKSTVLCVVLDEYEGNTGWPIYMSLDSLDRSSLQTLEDYFDHNNTASSVSLTVSTNENEKMDTMDLMSVDIAKILIDDDVVIERDIDGETIELTGKLSYYSNLYKEIYFSYNTESVVYGSYSHMVGDNAKTVVIDYRNAIKGLQYQIQKNFNNFIKVDETFISTNYANYYLLKPYKYKDKYYSSVMVEFVDWSRYDQLQESSQNNLNEEDIYNESIVGYLIVTQEYDHLVLSSLQQFMVDNSSTYFLAFLLIGGICIILAYMIIAPIHELEIATKHIASRKFDYPIDVKAHDEIGDLSRNIDMMSKKLEKTINDLYQEVDKVKKLENIRKDFVSNFTHEIKTPLGIINGFSELIELEQDENKRNEYIHIIQNETKRINELVLAMLEYSKLESQNIALDREEFDLKELVDSVIDSLLHLFEKKNIMIESDIQSVKVYGDRFKLEMVISNYITNALRYTAEGKKVYITLNNDGFMVENEGAFIPEEDLDKIWLTFHKVDKSRNDEGTGLGLAICRAILELHGFDFGVENTDKGVLFYFHFDELQ